MFETMPQTAASQSEAKPACCSGPCEEEIFHLFGYCWVFNVNLANEMVRDGRAPVELEEESLQYCVDTTDLIEEHIGHVNPDRPGIIAHVKYTTAEGELIHGHALIDGNHRAARCLQLGRPFFVFILSEEESEQIVVRRPHQGAIDDSIIPAEEAELARAESREARTSLELRAAELSPTPVPPVASDITDSAHSLQH
jgi:hypothetical protein